jgi:transposase
MNAPAQAIPKTSTLDLASLRQMSFEELNELYRAGKRPSTISDLDGDAIGAMLAWRSPRGGPLAWLLRTFGASSVFPWEGKTFKGTSDRGEGINRINLLGKRRWLQFGTRFDKSFLDGEPTFVLDYARPGNPPLIRQIVDEVREVAPGLYMGPAALRVGGRLRHILFFAVSHQ